MPKYRKKPVVIDAEIYTVGMEDGFDRCDSLDSVTCQEYNRFDWQCDKCPVGKGRPYINTLEGKHYISPGDYIITGVKGERYPCKEDIFELTYEPADTAPKGDAQLDELIAWLEECTGPNGWFDDLDGHTALAIKKYLLELRALRTWRTAMTDDNCSNCKALQNELNDVYKKWESDRHWTNGLWKLLYENGIYPTSTEIIRASKMHSSSIYPSSFKMPEDKKDE